MKLEKKGEMKMEGRKKIMKERSDEEKEGKREGGMG